MAQKITIDPVTRIEGHAKITIHLDDEGMVQKAFFHIGQVRGFEKLCEGRPFYEMPSLMARICGICPVSHLMASAKACDSLMGVRHPGAGRQPAAYHESCPDRAVARPELLYLSAPDLLLGMDADPSIRNIFGVIGKNPSIAREWHTPAPDRPTDH